MVFDNFDLQLEQNTNIDYLEDINEDTVEESQYEPTVEGAMMHIMEAEENWNKFQQAVALTELKGFKESGDVDFVLEAEQGESFFSKAIGWFKSMWGKIVQTYKKFVSYMMAKVSSDKQFIKKFEGAKINVPSGFKFKGYVYDFTFTLAEAGSKIDSVINQYFKLTSNDLNNTEEVQKALQDFNSNKNTVFGKMRGAVIGKDSATNSEFRKELQKKFRGGKDKPEEFSVSNGDIPGYIKIVKSHADAVSKAKSAMDDMKKDINKAIGDINGWKAGVKKLSDKKAKSSAMSYINAHISVLKNKATMLSVANAELIGNLNTQNKQVKAVLYQIDSMSSKPKKKSTNESGFLVDVDYE